MNLSDKFHLYIRESVIAYIEKEDQRLDKEIEKQLSDFS